MKQYNKLNEIIKLDKSKLVLLGGTAGIGKSVVGLDIAKDVALNDKTAVAVFSLETGIKECVNKIIGDDKSLKYIGKLAEANIFIDDTPNIAVDYIEEKCRELKQAKDIKFVLIGYLQLINYENDIESVSKKLKALSQELDLTILVLSQLSANVENKRPTIEDLKDSKAVADVSDVVTFLYKQDDTTEVIIAKNEMKM